AKGDNKAQEAAKMAIESPLLEVSIDGAKGVLFNVIGGRNLSMTEISEAAEIVKEKISGDATFIFGANIDESLEDEIRITVLATGFESDYLNAALDFGGSKLLETRQPERREREAAPTQQHSDERRMSG